MGNKRQTELQSRVFRTTETRRVLLQLLNAATAPLSVPDLVNRCHSAGRRANKTTIYRDLDVLEHAGIVRRVIVSDRKQYFELSTREHHHHFICVECNRVEDAIFDEVDLSKQEALIAGQKDFLVFRHSLEFFGLCKMCA